MQPLTIWTNYRLDDRELKRFAQDIAPHRLLSGPAGSAQDGLAEADIAFGQPDVASILASRTLRWIAISSAGYTKYDRDDVRAALRSRGAILTNGSSVFAEACAQHVLAWMLAGSRALPQAIQNQFSGRGWPCEPLRKQSRLLRGSCVLLVGFGAIATELARMLEPFEPRIIGFRRTPTGRETVPVLPISELDAHLESADHVVDILPESDSTRGFFNAARFARMSAAASFYNIGRGQTVDTQALCDALSSGSLSGAFLDVTHPEPLPPDHPLWKLPNCVITPHIGGGYGNEREAQLNHFVRNLRRLCDGEPLMDRVV